MSVWFWVLLACAIAYATKLLGFLVPQGLLESRRVMAVLGATTIGLLAALVATSTLAQGTRVVIDARLLAVLVAVIALRLRAPFLLVVVLGAASVAIGRMLGL